MITSIIAICLGFLEAVKEIVTYRSVWKSSIFSSKFKPDSYFGNGEDTHKRKWRYKELANTATGIKKYYYKTLNYLYTTVFVGLSDVWHGVDTVYKFLLYILFPITFIFMDGIIASGVFYLIQFGLFLWLIHSISFHVFYHYILRKKTFPKGLNKTVLLSITL